MKLNKVLLTILFLSITGVLRAQSIEIIKEAFEQYLQNAKENNYQYHPDSLAKLDTISIQKKNKKLIYFLSKHWEYKPIREEGFLDIEQQVRSFLPKKYTKYDLIFYVGKSSDKSQQKWARKNKYPITPKCLLEDLIPNYYRYPHLHDTTRYIKNRSNKVHVKRLNSHQDQFIKEGLLGKHIALWNSHGWYYEQSLERWEWQRARLFQTVEDLLPTAFVLPYLIPMLENAGANVYSPRERDIQSDILVIDNDGDREGYLEKGSIVAGGKGFLNKNFYNTNENPFELGTTRNIRTTTNEQIAISWETKSRIKGSYAVYVSYGKSDLNVEDAHYIVKHKKQKTSFLVNQKMGYGTWVYLGTFSFDGSEGEGVYLSSKSKKKGHYISADAIRFGGGKGNIVRGKSASDRPRFMEGARYHLQYSGAPLNVYTPNEGKNDYKDDYQSRGEWVNWLTGADFALSPELSNSGLGIPIDVAIALHTDAGISKSDTTIGTLAIYSTTNMEKETNFKSSQSRYSNRDLADIIQTQIVNDIRVLHDSIWNRREMWDKRYSEAVYPDVPTVLIELLSHQNFKDMWYALDPVFRFDVSRAMYKGVLKYLSYQYGYDYVVQPLKPQAFTLDLKDHQAKISWQEQLDPLESTASPTAYKLYTNKNNQGWDNGVIINDTQFKVDIDTATFYRFRVTAINSGGESFPTEELCMADFNNSPILVVNAFDRVAAPSYVFTEKYAGFTNLDEGVADGVDISYTGNQYDFNPSSPWQDDDAPGFGGSFADFETDLIEGNTHDFSKIHGESLFYLKQSFVSCSKKAIENGTVDLNNYRYIDFLFGEQRSSESSLYGKRVKYEMFSENLKSKVKSYLSNGGNLLLSGAYIGSELFFNFDGTPKGRKHPDVLFGMNTLHFVGRSNNADKGGVVFSVNDDFDHLNDVFYSNKKTNSIYSVESPDALEPFGDNSYQIGRYKSNNKGAVVAFSNNNQRIILLGFPFETITSEQKRIELMEEFLLFFNK